MSSRASSADELATVRRVLDRTGLWAVVGWSPRPERPSHGVADYLVSCGYRVAAVNPDAAGLPGPGGTPVRASLAQLEEPIDVVDVFRRSSRAGEVVDQAIEVGAAAVWLQLGVIDEEAAQRARAAGLDVVMDRCPRIERPRLLGR